MQKDVLKNNDVLLPHTDCVAYIMQTHAFEYYDLENGYYGEGIAICDSYGCRPSDLFCTSKYKFGIRHHDLGGIDVNSVKLSLLHRM